MSDDEVSTNASLTIRTQAIDIKVGDYLLIDGRPCKVVERTWSSPGKHGVGKFNFTGLDIFTGHKHITIIQSGKNTPVPIVIKTEYQLIDINEEDDDTYVSLLPDNNTLRQDIKLPDGELSNKIKEEFNNNN